MADEEKKKASEGRFELVQIPTEHRMAFQDNSAKSEEEKFLSVEQLIQIIANDVEQIKRNIA